MSGSNYLLDTNAVIALLNSNKAIEAVTRQVSWIGIYVISIIKFLSFKDLTSKDKELFTVFLQRIIVLDLSYQNDVSIISLTGQLWISNRFKLPDAIIAASAILTKSVLVKNDAHFTKIANLQILTF